jgi:hypothetical protein
MMATLARLGTSKVPALVIAAASSAYVPALNPSRLPLVTAMVPVWAPPPLRFRVPWLTLRVPLLSKATEIVVVPAPVLV